jgi:hypothetical protein
LGTDPDKAQGARKWLTGFFQTQDVACDLRLTDPLRLSAGSWVFAAHLDDAPVVIKRFLTPDPAPTVLGMKAELDFLEEALDDPRFQANRCLMAWPDAGIVALSHAQGARLDAVMARSAGAARLALFRAAGEWLRRYCALRRRDATFGPRYWVRKLEAVPLDHIPAGPDRDLAGALLNSIRKRIEMVRGVPVVQAATHGDFVGMNVHVHQGALCGVDIQGESWLPVARDAARFLVWSQIHDDDRPSHRRYGIATADVDAFLQSGVLARAEKETTLPFFIAEQLFLRFAENHHRPRLRDNMRAAIGAYLTPG